MVALCLGLAPVLRTSEIKAFVTSFNSFKYCQVSLCAVLYYSGYLLTRSKHKKYEAEIRQ